MHISRITVRGVRIIRNAVLITGGIVVLAFLCLDRIDRREIIDTDAFRSTFEELALPDQCQVVYGRIEAGWSRRHIVPDAPLRLAGYGFSGKFNGVHDSLYVRVIAVRSKEAEAFIISADLLMFPRELAHCVEREVSLRYGTNAACYFTASHTHKGYGNWDPSPAGQIILGMYWEELVAWLCERIMDALEEARAGYQYASIGYRKSDAKAWVLNRIDPTAPADGWLRGIEITCEDGKKALLLSFAAHPVNIGDPYPALSNDYAAYLISALEGQSLADMAVFAAGMVGSHNAPRGDARDYDRARWIAEGLFETYLVQAPLPAADSAVIGFRKAPVFLPDPQLRLAPGIRLRPWLFELLFGKQEAYIRALRIGDVLMLGMPCDFSGEIAVLDGFDAYAKNRDLNLFITSFNGAYIGYITADHHYDKSRHEEVMAMNWVGPGMGRYFSAVIAALIDRHSPPLSGPVHDSSGPQD